jgi:hypothetical protein
MLGNRLRWDLAMNLRQICRGAIGRDSRSLASFRGNGLRRKQDAPTANEHDCQCRQSAIRVLQTADREAAERRAQQLVDLPG